MVREIQNPEARVRQPLGRRLRESPLSAFWISAAVHLAAFGVLMRIVWQDRPLPRREIIAEAWLGPEMTGGGTRNGPAPGHPAAPPADAIESLGAGGANAASPDDDVTRLISTIVGDGTDAVGRSSRGDGPTGGIGIGLGLSGGSFGGEGRAAAGTFGGVTSGGPETGFFGQRGNAYKVVYVIDTSGSLAWLFEPVQQALIDSIDQLMPSQSFHVIFAGSRPVELAARQLVPAIAAYKEPAKKFIRELVPILECDPVAAMERAFAVGPELIYFLTDGDFRHDKVAQLLAKLREWNADGRVHITTIGFGVRLEGSQVAGTPVGEPLLRQIAREHGGNFRWVSPDDAQGGGG